MELGIFVYYKFKIYQSWTNRATETQAHLRTVYRANARISRRNIVYYFHILFLHILPTATAMKRVVNSVFIVKKPLIVGVDYSTPRFRTPWLDYLP